MADAKNAPGEETPVVPAIAADAVTPPITTETPPVLAGGDPAETPPAAEASAPAAGVLPAEAETPAAVTESEPTLLEKFDAEQKATKDEKPAVEAKPDEKPATEEKPVEEKPVEAEKADEPKVEEPEAEKAALEAIDYFDKLELPEGVKPTDDDRKEITAAFDAFRADPKAGTKGLLDLHVKQMNALQERLVRGQWDTFNQTRKDWQTQVMADPILGGAGYQTAMGKVAMARDTFISTAQPGTPKYEAEAKEFADFLKVTGAGDHPAFLRFLHNASRYVREGSQPPPNGGVPKDIGKAPGRRGKLNYDNPTSNPDQ